MLLGNITLNNFSLAQSFCIFINWYGKFMWKARNSICTYCIQYQTVLKNMTYIDLFTSSHIIINWHFLAPLSFSQWPRNVCSLHPSICTVRFHIQLHFLVSLLKSKLQQQIPRQDSFSKSSLIDMALKWCLGEQHILFYKYALLLFLVVVVTSLCMKKSKKSQRGCTIKEVPTFVLFGASVAGFPSCTTT